MKLLSEFLQQKAPKSSASMPAYYRKALLISEGVFAVFFLTSAILLEMMIGHWAWPPIVILGAMIVCLARVDNMGGRGSFICFSVIIAAWLTWFVHSFGWTAGSPNILVTALSLAYFNIYIPPKGKLAFSVGLIAFRIGLYAYSLNNFSIIPLDHTVSICLQIINSVVPLVVLSVHFILFSSSIQASERTLALHNQELHKEAATDPLTGLLNRRALLDIVEKYRNEQPDAQFGIAIADIDFFKRVNDTYGHNCGDYTLKELSRLFQELANARYQVCRWGGEEFCFFLPGLNLDEAGIIMHDIHMAAGNMPLHFNDIDFMITITIGVEENDFRSTMEQLFDRADRKLYMGKANGRDQVVI